MPKDTTALCPGCKVNPRGQSSPYCIRCYEGWSKGGPDTPPTPPDAGTEKALDAARYRRLRILGATPSTSQPLTVLRFPNLDDFIDADIKRQVSRGEYVPIEGSDADPSLEDRLRQLSAKWREYAQHKDTCASHYCAACAKGFTDPHENVHGACDCGLDALLSERPTP